MAIFKNGENKKSTTWLKRFKFMDRNKVFLRFENSVCSDRVTDDVTT